MRQFSPAVEVLLEAADAMTQEIMLRASRFIVEPGFVPSVAQARMIAAYAATLTTIMLAGGPDPVQLEEKQ